MTSPKEYEIFTVYTEAGDIQGNSMDSTQYVWNLLLFEYNEYLTELVDEGHKVENFKLSSYFKWQIPMSVWLTADWGELCSRINKEIEEMKA